MTPAPFVVAAVALMAAPQPPAPDRVGQLAELTRKLQQADPARQPGEPLGLARGDFSYFRAPPEPAPASGPAQLLADDKADPNARLAAARGRWAARDRSDLTAVLQLLAAPPSNGAYRTFRREVEAALTPEAILRELKSGDFAWGAALAAHRPHADLVPELLAGLDRDADFPPAASALGHSGDRRALAPLLASLKGDDTRNAVAAALALGSLDAPEAETPLMAALFAESRAVRLAACSALERVGTPAALPVLDLLVRDERGDPTGYVSQAATRAVVAIEARAGRRGKR